MNWDNFVKGSRDKGAAARERITEEAANGAERAAKNPWRAAVIVMVALVLAFVAGAVIF